MKAVKELFGLRPIIGCEVGVNIGSHADDILKNLNIDLIYLVDKYEMWSHHKILAQQNLEKYKDSIKWLFGDSSSMSVNVSDNTLDFCYIDADHRYEQMLNDIKAWIGKVKIGGIICGHDYNPKGGNTSDAVQKYFKDKKINCGLERSSVYDWWVYL